MGMTPHDFWEGDVTLLSSYRKMFEQKQKHQLEDDNFRCWLQGRYIYEALVCALANAFAKKNAKSVEYLCEPYDLFKERDSEKEKEKEQKKRENENIRFKLQMNALINQFSDLPFD